MSNRQHDHEPSSRGASQSGRARLSTLLFAFLVLSVAASALVVVRGRAAGGRFPWPASLSRNSFLGSGWNATITYAGGSGNDVILTVLPALSPGAIQFSTAGYLVSESGTNALITFKRVGGTLGPVSATFQTSNGSATAPGDYTGVNQSVSWADGDASDQTVNVPIIDDGIAEGYETVHLALSNPQGGATLGAPSLATLTITDNDSANTVIVNTLDDQDLGACLASPGHCSLREAVKYAPADSHVTFAVTGTIFIVNGELSVNNNLNIDGPGASLVTVDGSNASRVFVFLSGYTDTVSGLTIAHANGNGNGGGISNTANLTVTDCVLSTNHADAFGGGIVNLSPGTLTVNSSTLVANSASPSGGASGGGIASFGGTVTINNSTFFGNTTRTSGAGIWSSNTTLSINSSTFNSNSGGFCDGFGCAGTGGGVSIASGSATINNTIISGNSSQGGGPDLSGTVDSGDYNLILVPGGSFTTGGANNITGSDPLLGPLQNNGGATPTMALPVNSPAIDQGLSGSLTIDQRAGPRPVDLAATPNASGGDGADIGAFEYDVAQVGTTLVVNTADDVDDGLCTVGHCSLREAINAANANVDANTITFNIPGGPTQNITLQSPLPLITQSVTIQGPTDDNVTVDGAFSYRVFDVTTAPVVNISDLTVDNAQGGVDSGGGLWNEGTGAVTVLGSTFTGNEGGSAAGSGGGGAANTGGGTLTLTNCTFQNNITRGGNGGAIFNSNGVTNLLNVTVAENSAVNFSSTPNGGGVAQTGGTINVQNTIIAGNSSEGPGPDIFGSFTSQGHNLIGDGTDGTGFVNGTNGDQVGTTNAPINPRLNQLSNYGGPTPTMELLPGSPALEAGDNTGAPGTDQRGIVRPQGSTVDIGAFELQAFVVTKTADTDNTCLPGDCSLREAIKAANSAPYSQMIAFNIPPGDGGCDINGVCTINPTPNPLPGVNDTVFIDGYSQPGAKPNDLDFGNGDNAILKIQLSGTGLPGGSLGIDLHYGAEWSDVRGLIINNFDGAGVWVENDGPTQISGNFIGTNAAGTAAAANGDGVTIIYGEDHLIGGDRPAERNIISGNRTNGVFITGDEANDNSVEGNFIGTTRNGDAVLPNVVGVLINSHSENNIVGCEVPNGDNLISGNTSAGVRIEGSIFNTVEGNFIGTDKTGTTGLANDTGVYLKGSGINDVGLPDFGNLISGNVNAGVLIESTPSSGASIFNFVEGNRIGTNLSGTGSIANKVGIVIRDSSSNTIGGGNVSGDRNYISGNTEEGIRIEVSGPSASSNNNSIFGNSIGADVAGTGSIPNGGSGVKIIGGVQNEVGCTFTGSGNVISGNSGEGVELTGGAGNNFVQGNLIGVKADSSAGLANGGSGVEIYSTMSQPSTDNVVGVLPDFGGEERARRDKTTSRAAQNGIAPKPGPCRALPERNALKESKAKELSQARLARQKTDGTRANSEAPRRVNGVKPKRRSLNAKLARQSRFTALAEASSSVKGATRMGPSFTPPSTVTVNGGNLIAYNLEDGVKISSAGDVNNLISQNSIYSNGKLGINLVGRTESAEGVTANDSGDADDGPNRLQNFPVITDAAADTQTIYGTLDSSSDDGPFTIEFFASDGCDGSGNGEGKTWIGSTQSGVGNFNFTAYSDSFIAGQTITATATDSSGNTSEFSSCFIASATSAGADLYIEKTDSPDPVTVGGTLTYTITVFSHGPADAHNVQVTDTLPASVTWVSSTASQGGCTGTSTVTCDLGTVSYGQTPTVTIVVTAPNTPGPITNFAGVSSPDDSFTENNSASADTQVMAACPTYFTVNDNGDASDVAPGDSICATAGAVCTLRAAIEEANALSSCGTIDINFSGVTGLINLGTALPSINHNVNINGPGANVLTVRRSSASTFRIFTISSGKTVSINDLTISNGSASIGGGIYNNRGTLAVRYCTVSGNTASSFGGGIHNGGIGSGNAALSILNSTISGNSSVVDGGGVYSDAGSGTASLTMINSTVSGNTANNHVGGVYVISSTATLTNVTITNNRADNDNVGGGAAGGLSESSGTVTLHNTIVAGNFRGASPSTTRDDINGAIQLVSSYNLIGDGTGMSGISDGANNNQVGSAGSPINALLGVLQDNGGPTFTHGLLYNSPAVDKGDDAVIGPPLQLGTDQRGLARQADGDLTAGAVVDIGAYERQSTESRRVPDGANIHVNLVDVILGFPCVPSGNCTGGLTRKDDVSAAAPLSPAGSPAASITVIDPAGQPAPPVGYVIGNAFNPPLPAFDLSTTASFDSPINVCFYLPSITDPSFFTGLKILHHEGSALVDRTTGQNFASKLVCASVNSLSPFVVGHTVTPTATNGNVSGQILDHNGHPVEGAGIRMSGTQTRLTVTDANGNYRFDSVETNGFYTVAPSRANYSFSPAQRSFSALGQQTEAAFSAATNGSALNPLDTTEYFVRQQYLDFLGREPDEPGLNFWYQNIESCGDDGSCRAAKHVDTSAAFFLSIEFQQTGYLVYRTYQAAYGDLPGAPVPLRLDEFKPDSATIGNGVVVNKLGWETQLENNKQAYLAAFVQRLRFTGAYPAAMTPAEFVDRLFVNAAVSPSTEARSIAIAEFGSAATSSDVAARGRALRRVAENSVLARQEFNQAFVLMQYFGYLRRDANAGADTDFSGYNFWLNKLNSFQGNFGDAEMVKAFLLSGEYRGRFPR